jgi:hypothetical protein
MSWPPLQRFQPPRVDLTLDAEHSHDRGTVYHLTVNGVADPRATW